MQGIIPPAVAQLLAAGQVPLAKLELSFVIGTLNFDSGSVEPQVNEILTGATSGATAKVLSVNRTGGTWVGTNASGSIELGDCSGCFNDNEDINGSVGGANILTVNHPDGTVGVDKHAKNGAFVHDVDPPNDWAGVNCTLLTIAGGQVGNCVEITRTGAGDQHVAQVVALTIGKIYKFSFYVKSGTSGNEAFRGKIDQVVDFDIDGTSTANWVHYSGTFECDKVDPAIRLYKRTATAGTMLFDEVILYELEWINLCDLDTKHYVESVSVSLGGASMTPNPIGGKWGAVLANEDSIFHPEHPTSGYGGYCVTGREVRISIGATYGGVDYYYQRIIGYMDEPKFSAPDYKVSINGQDYMKRLEDAEFQEMDGTHPNHWGLSTTFDSWPSDGLLGNEMYINQDAMDILLEQHDVVGWAATNCTFVSLIEGSGGSLRVGKMTGATAPAARIINTDIGTNAVAGRTYRVKFKHKIVGGDGTKGIRIQIHQTALIKSVIYFPTNDWKEETLYFIATDIAAIEMRFYFSPVAYELWLDQISVWEYKPEEDRYYDLTGADANQKGPFYLTYDDGGGAVVVQQGEEDEGWWYDETTGHVFFDRNKTVIDGTGLNNVVIHYYTATDPEDAIARILWFAGLGYLGTPYANEAAALVAMDNDDPGFSIDKVWFEAGTSFLSAIKMLCEVCNYRFHFKYSGQPSFKAPPGGGVVFTFSDPSQIASQRTYHSRSEIKNRVIIKGIKRAEPVNRDDSVPSELIGDASDAASITAYGERTLTITNHLFQTQARIDAMCVTLRNLYKTPKWYANLKIPFNPVPLELGDEIQWEERLSPILNVTQTGIIRDIKISNFTVTYKIEMT
jgi:hypothetical protein